jgi:phospholipase/carboxylesterase
MSSPESDSKVIEGFQTTILDYNCGGNKQHELVFFFLHGLGAEASQFSDIATMLMSKCAALKDKPTRFVMPQANQLSGMDTVGWFMLDQMGLMMAMMGGEQAQAAKLRETPLHMVETRNKLISLFKETAEGVPVNKWFIGGFSMGATMTCEISSQLTGKLGGMLVCSGIPLNVTSWAQGFATLEKTRCLLMHGKNDPMIPVMVSGWTQYLLSNSGLDVIYHLHNGGHDLGSQIDMNRIITYFQDQVTEAI